MKIDDWKRLAEAATPGPYFVALDDAEECGPHANSGLSLVETGRNDDWPIARLCETQSANYIAASHPARVLQAIAVIEAAKAMHKYLRREADPCGSGDDFIAALAELEAMP